MVMCVRVCAWSVDQLLQLARDGQGGEELNVITPVFQRAGGSA